MSPKPDFDMLSNNETFQFIPLFILYAFMSAPEAVDVGLLKTL